MRLAHALLIAALLAGCSASPSRTSTATPAASDRNLNSTLWMQTSAEYDASVLGIFAAARRSLDRALADPTWNALPIDERRDGFERLPPAIIVDADETMIDNSAFQARGVRDGVGYERSRWIEWVNQRRATAVPGALEFARHATARGVPIYFVTNRDAPAETESTIANLRALDFPIAADASNVMLRGDPRASAREKSDRRRWVGARHRVVLLLGDNLGDFIDQIEGSVAERDRYASPYADWWGERWFMLPNPTYGSWESALEKSCGDAQSEPIRCARAMLRVE